MYRLGQRPALDGVRALAVAAVVLYHASFHLPGGRYGVDVFFLLSGYLITSLLLEERAANGNVNLGAFYMRRARRLLPALAGTLVLVAAIFAVSASFNGNLGLDILAVALYSANWLQVAGHQVGGGMLTHTWSLAVEEQFYILWPVALIFFWKRRGLVPVLLGLAVASAVVRSVALSTHHDAFAVYATASRADGLMLGCALAIALHRGAQLAFLRRSLWGWAGIAALAVVGLRNPGPAALDYIVVVAASGLIVGHLAVSTESSLVSALSTRPLRWLGARSYGVYLYHMPILFGLGLGALPRHERLPAQVALILVVSAVSYRYIETPFRHRKPHSFKEYAVPVPR